jgi:hypothetical protein
MQKHVRMSGELNTAADNNTDCLHKIIISVLCIIAKVKDNFPYGSHKN